MQILSEQRFPLAEAAERVGRNVSTLWRWSQSGVKGRVLETQLIGGRRFTSVEALERFVEAINSPAGTPTPARSESQREKATAAARAALAKDGII
ncbi:MAG: DUF1580 domain-containing protein [Planctomycetaceae bacterium]